MDTQPGNVTVHTRSDPYKFGWTIGIYVCGFEDGANDAARYESRYAHSDPASLKDFCDGYSDGRECRKAGPAFQLSTDTVCPDSSRTG